MPKVLKKCSRCPRPKWSTSSYCRPCHVEYENVKFSDPQYRLWASSYVNARNRRVPHTIVVADIPLPTHCLFLGCELDYRRSHDNKRPFDIASIDRIVPSLGYVPGNIQVISWLANRMKQDATPEQLIAFANSILEIYGTEY